MDFYSVFRIKQRSVLWPFVVEKPTIQLQLMQLKVRKTAGLLKTYFHEIKRGFLSHCIFANFYVKLKNDLL